MQPAASPVARLLDVGAVPAIAVKRTSSPETLAGCVPTWLKPPAGIRVQAPWRGMPTAVQEIRGKLWLAGLEGHVLGGSACRPPVGSTSLVIAQPGVS